MFLVQMEITQHARYTCTFCGKVRFRTTLGWKDESFLMDGLYTGLRKTPGRRHLEMQLMQEDHRGWCVDPLDNRRGDRAQVRSQVLFQYMSC